MATMKRTVSWEVMSCSPIGVHQHVIGIYCLHLQVTEKSIDVLAGSKQLPGSLVYLKDEAVSSSGMLTVTKLLGISQR
jgi:hypothetical protein